MDFSILRTSTVTGGKLRSLSLSACAHTALAAKLLLSPAILPPPLLHHRLTTQPRSLSSSTPAGRSLSCTSTTSIVLFHAHYLHTHLCPEPVASQPLILYPSFTSYSRLEKRSSPRFHSFTTQPTTIHSILICTTRRRLPIYYKPPLNEPTSSTIVGYLEHITSSICIDFSRCDALRFASMSHIL